MISYLYTTVALVNIIAYLPQVIRLMRNNTKCDDISIKAWLLWEYVSIVSLLYSVFELQDIKLSIANATNVFFNTLIISITIYKRIKYETSVSILINEEKIPDEHQIAEDYDLK